MVDRPDLCGDVRECTDYGTGARAYVEDLWGRAGREEAGKEGHYRWGAGAEEVPNPKVVEEWEEGVGVGIGFGVVGELGVYGHSCALMRGGFRLRSGRGDYCQRARRSGTETEEEEEEEEEEVDTGIEVGAQGGRFQRQG